MKRFKLTWNDHCLIWVKDYGIDRRTGWTVIMNGSIIVQLEPWLLVALFKAWRYVRKRKGSGWDSV